MNEYLYTLYTKPKNTYNLTLCNTLSFNGLSDVPCWFHRKMQELVFGFKWEKVK